MQDTFPYRFSKVFTASWNSILELSETVLGYSQPLKDNDFWPVLALGKRACGTMKGIGALATLELWSDALVLSRSLLELEITIKWILQQDVKGRLRTYLSGISQEKKRLLNKMNAGISVSAQVLSMLINSSDLGTDTATTEIQSSWSGQKVRELAREVGMEQNYDLPYWISSMFAHAHALSVLEFHPDKRKESEVLAGMFSQKSGDFLSTMVMEAVPCQFLHILGSIDKGLDLGLEPAIAATWQKVHQSFNKGEGVQYIYPSETESGTVQGDLSLVGPEGPVHIFKPKRLPTVGKRKRRRR